MSYHQPSPRYRPVPPPPSRPSKAGRVVAILVIGASIVAGVALLIRAAIGPDSPPPTIAGTGNPATSTDIPGADQIGVAILPGLTAFTRMPRRADSRAGDGTRVTVPRLGCRQA